MDARPPSLVFVTLTPTPPTQLAPLARAVDVLAAGDGRLHVAWHADGSSSRSAVQTMTTSSECWLP